MKIILSFLFLFTFIMVSEAQYSLSKLADKADFDKLSGLPLSDKYGQVSAIKIIFDLKTEKLYFVNSNYYKYHHEFCSAQLNYDSDLSIFNEFNYSNDARRRYLLANINYYKSMGVYALEIAPVDLMTRDQILKLYSVANNATFIGNRLKFLLNSARLLDEKKLFEERIPVLNPFDVYGNLNYQAISKHTAFGVLRYIQDFEAEKSSILPTDIIVLEETPLYLPKVAGILVSEFQTPLSHLTILGQNRKIPIAAYKSAFKDTVLRKLANKQILFKVETDSFQMYLTESNPALKQRNRVIKLKYDLSVDSLVEIANLDKKSYIYAGNKASNFAILYQLSQRYDFKTPESAFVIPFYFYHKHICLSPAKAIIDKVLDDGNIRNNSDSLQRYLKAIRQAIVKTSIDSILLKSINEKIVSLGGYTQFRFRSSTNAEDADGFSGAGLYTSKTGIVNSKEKTIDEAIKKVWASMWSFEAYSEREYFGMQHRDAYMAILVHRAFPDEWVNGVAITKNIYRPDSYGFVINAQLGDKSVVKPDSGIVDILD